MTDTVHTIKCVSPPPAPVARWHCDSACADWQDTGYRHPDYARSLESLGRPRRLRHCEGWILERQIPDVDDRDAMGCYPLFMCRRWDLLAKDIAEIAPSLVSLAIVTDPFGSYDEQLLSRCFEGASRPFKRHFVTDLTMSPSQYLDSHHRRNLRKSRRSVSVEITDSGDRRFGAWVGLYDALKARHGITGPADFSSESMAIQWKVPGLTVFVSLLDGLPIAMHLWYLHDSVAYYHLGASNQDGYRVGANFALMMAAIEYFSDQGHRWLALGGEAGLHSKEDGLTRFKRGWSTDTRMAYFCGRVLQPARYAQLVRSRNVSSDYFPQYRTPLNSRAAA